MATQVANLEIRGYGNFRNLVRDLENATDKKTAKLAIDKLTLQDNILGSWFSSQSPLDSAKYYINTPSKLPGDERYKNDTTKLSQLADKAERLILEKSSEFNINSGFSRTQIALCSALGLSAIGAGIAYSGVVDINALASTSQNYFSNLFSGNSSVVNNATTQAGYGYAAKASDFASEILNVNNPKAAGIYSSVVNNATTQAGYGYAAKASDFASEILNVNNLKAAGTAVTAGILGLVSLKAFR